MPKIKINKFKQNKIASERIKILFKMADKDFNKNPERSNRYIELARKIAMRFNIRIPTHLKRKYCKKCYKYILPGINCRVRTNEKQKSIIITCLECGYVMRYPYRKEKKNKEMII